MAVPPPTRNTYSGRAREYETVGTVRAPMLLGETVEFAALPNGDLIVDDESGDADLYRSRKRSSGIGTASLTADGKPAGSHIRELERAGRACGPDFAVRAERLDSDLWEVRAAAL